MKSDRSLAAGVAACLLVAGVLLVIDRGGLLAWLGVTLGALSLSKALLRPSPRDLVVTCALLGLWTAAWGGTWYYVMSTWESGEVVELEVAGEHTARVWIIDTTAGPHMYYDAPREIASLLLAGSPITMRRGDRMTRACAAAVRASEVPASELQSLIDQMDEKYEDRTTATTVFYAVLGVERDRVGLIIEPAPCG